jgi:N-acetyl-1-D-myo-inositol-2-amino-2-deoxy-alpha-D-glucopyranoside deacetylase
MAGTPSAANPTAFANADVDEAAALVADVVRRVRPAVVVTYDEQGGYGHPDHVQTHRVTRRALQLLDAAELPGRTYEIVTPLGWAREDRAWLAAHVPDDAGWVVPGEGDPFPSQVGPDQVVTHRVVDPSVVPVQSRALECHATQVVVGEGWYALSNHVVSRLAGREGYARLDAATGRPIPEGAP